MNIVTISVRVYLYNEEEVRKAKEAWTMGFHVRFLEDPHWDRKVMISTFLLEGLDGSLFPVTCGSLFRGEKIWKSP